MPRTFASLGLLIVFAVVLGLPKPKADERPTGSERQTKPQKQVAELDRSPVDVALSSDGSWLVSANQTSDSVSLIDVNTQSILSEVQIGDHPAFVEICPDDRTVLVSCQHAGVVEVLSVSEGTIKRTGQISVGFHPCGLAVRKDAPVAYVGLVASGEVAEIHWETKSVQKRFAVGHWPRYLTLSPDGKQLAVGCAGESKIVVLDTESGKPLHENRLIGGINLGHLQASRDGKFAYFPWMVYRSNPITAGNIRLGWVLASRIGRVRLDEDVYREAISLDVPRKAIADPHGLVISSDEKRLVVSASGTHELLIYRLPDLPFVGVGGPGDLIDRGLQNNRERFSRLDVGGRPMGLAMSPDGRTVYIANYLNNSIQIADIEEGTVEAEIHLGGPAMPSLARQGEALFYDGQRSLDQWYSCHSCHQDAGTNARAMDTMNDGTRMTFKTVLPLTNVTRTAPWTWHGWQTDLDDAMHKSLTVTMLGPQPAEDDKKALIAYLDGLKLPPNPFRNSDGSLTAAAKRGEAIFQSEKAACASCHNGPFFTDGKTHDVGQGSEKDHYDGFNTPSLLGVYQRPRLLHHGRAKSLESLLTNYHAPEKVAGSGKLSEQEVQDLIAYLKSL